MSRIDPRTGKVAPAPPPPPPRIKPSRIDRMYQIALAGSDGRAVWVNFGFANLLYPVWEVAAVFSNASYESLGKDGRWGTWRPGRRSIILTIDPIDVFVLLDITFDKYLSIGNSGNARYIVTPAQDALNPLISWEVLVAPP